MKNRATPLAAALILAASAASAQLLQTTGSGTGLNLGSTNNSPFAPTSPANTDPDWIFKCSTPPYLPCTPAEILRRDAVKTSQKCPTVPATAKCMDFVMRNGDSNPMANYSAQTPPEGYKWSSPDCQRIPCRIDPVNPTTPNQQAPSQSPAQDSGQEYGVTGGLIGPPCPPDICKTEGPQPFQDDASFKAAMAVQEAATPGKVIDLGNRSYAYDVGDGTYALGGQINGRPVSGRPNLPEAIPGLQAAIEKKAIADKLAAETRKADENMFTGTSAGGDQNRTATPPGGGRDDGASVDGVQRQLGGGRGSGGPGVASTGGGSGSSGGGAGSTGGGADVIKVAGSSIKLGEIETTFVRNQNMEKLINGAAKNYKSGQMTNFVDGSGQVGGTVNGRQADPPVDAKYLGKQQWAAQEDAKKP